MKFERTKNATNAFAFGLIGKIITMVGPFFTRTAIILILGAEYTGLSGLFTSVLSVLNITELGIGAAASFCMYEPVAKDDSDTVCALLSLVRKLYYIVGGVILAGGILMMPFLRLLIKGTVPADINLYWLYILYLLNSAVSYFGFAYKDILFRAYQRGDILNQLMIAANIVKYVLQIIVLVCLRNYYIYVVILLLCDIAYTVCIGVKSKKFFPQLQPKGTLPVQVKKKFWGKVTFLSFHSISSKLINSADNIVLSAFSGLTAITLYGNYSYLTSAILGIILIAYGSIAPTVGNTICTETKEKVLEVFDGLWLGCTWVTVWCTTCFLCLFQPFIATIWLKSEEYLLPISTVLIICLYFFSNSINQFFTKSYINPAGLWNKTLFRQIFAAVINLVLDIILVPKYGIGGIVFASLVASAGISLPYDIVVVYRYVLKEKAVKGFLKLGKCVLLLIAAACISWLLCQMIPVGGVVGFFLQCGVCLIIPNLLLLLVSFRTKEFAFIKSHVLVLMHRK